MSHFTLDVGESQFDEYAALESKYKQHGPLPGDIVFIGGNTEVPYDLISRDYVSGDCVVRDQRSGSERYVDICEIALPSGDIRIVTNLFEARYRILEALIQQGPCTTSEIEKTIRNGDGTELSALPILRDLEHSCVELDRDTYKWKIIGTRTNN